jgi:hypothetical protein
MTSKGGGINFAGYGIRFAGEDEVELGRVGVVVDDRQAGQVLGVAHLVDDGGDVLEDLGDGHGVHLAAVIVAGLDGLLEVAACCLGGEIVGDDLAIALLLLDPGDVRHGYPDGFAVDGKADIGGVGMARGDGDDGALPDAVQRLCSPAVDGYEIFVHAFSLDAGGE